jgi:tetratricopeptide (TPR) repeat protein
VDSERRFPATTLIPHVQTVDELLALGRQHEERGDFRQAGQFYLQAVQSDSRSGEAQHRLGGAYLRAGKIAEAVTHLQQAVKLTADSADAYSDLGAALGSDGRLEAAIDAFKNALRLNPKHADARCNLGNALRQQRRLDEAAACLEEVIVASPSHYQAHMNLGRVRFDQRNWQAAHAHFAHAAQIAPHDSQPHFLAGCALAEQGKLADAIACFERACQLQPRFVDGYYQLGKALVQIGRPADGLGPLERACLLQPHSPEIQNAVGVALAELHRFDAALPYFQEALRFFPKFPSALANQGDALRRCGRIDEALESLRRAVALAKNDAGAHHNLALVFADKGDFASAGQEHELAIQLQPENALFHKNRALLWLRLGEWEKGWPEFEWRWKCREFPKRAFSQPPWDGSPLNGRTILLYSEQGLGDVLHFIRYAPLVKERGGVILLQCPASMHPILSCCKGIDRFVVQDPRMPDFDVHAPLMSLPGIMGTTVANVPAAVPYIFAHPEGVEHWQKLLQSTGGFRIGVCWQGSRAHSGDRQRSFALAELSALARLPNVSLISLQAGVGREQLDSVRAQFPVTDFGAGLDRDSGAFMDTAAIMKHLDLVITCDTAIGHLAGALGVPVWLALSTVSDWRWLLDRQDTPWYPTMRLFRQKELGSWRPVFAQMARELSVGTA